MIVETPMETVHDFQQVANAYQTKAINFFEYFHLIFL